MLLICTISQLVVTILANLNDELDIFNRLIYMTVQQDK